MDFDQRIQKLSEDAGIKVDSVATDVLGLSCRAMLQAFIAGERDPEVLAEMALTLIRPKIDDLRESSVGRFDDQGQWKPPTSPAITKWAGIGPFLTAHKYTDRPQKMS